MGDTGRVSVQIETQPFKLVEGESVTLTANVHGACTPDSYSWRFGDGTESDSGSTVSHTYTEPGQYSIFCTVTGDDGKVYKGCSYVIVYAQDALEKPLRYLTFDDDDNNWEWYLNTGISDSLYDDDKSVEKITDGSNGYLRFYINDDDTEYGKDFMGELWPNEWNINHYPIVKAKYKIEPGTPVAMYLCNFPSYNFYENRLTDIGENIVYVAASSGCGMDTPFALIDDNEWHDITIDARDYFDTEYIQSVGFKNPTKPQFANPGDEWYLDSFSIEPDENLLDNPGFEEPSTSPWEVSDGWEGSNYTVITDDPDISTDDPCRGQKCIKLINNKTCDDIWQVVEVEPNTDYIFSFFAKVGYEEALSCTAYTVDWDEIPGSICCSESQGWTQYAIAFNSGSLTEVMLVIEDFGGAAYPGECVSYIDDTDLRPAASALEKAKAAAARNESIYTTESWQVLSSALEMPEATLSDILAKTTAINNAIAALVES